MDVQTVPVDEPNDLNVMVRTDERAAADRAVDRLRADGHEVLRCFEHGQPM